MQAESDLWPVRWLEDFRQDTGYAPAWGVERAAADYIAWLRAGNER